MHTINPCGCRSLSENLPPCASTMVRAIERPRPKPAASSIFRASSPRTNGSSITSLRASEMPGPSSSTSIVKLSGEALRRIGYRSSSSDRGAAAAGAAPHGHHGHHRGPRAADTASSTDNTSGASNTSSAIDILQQFLQSLKDSPSSSSYDASGTPDTGNAGAASVSALLIDYKT